MGLHSTRFKKRWIFFPLLCAVLFLAHRPLILFGCKLAIRTYLPSAHYEKIEWEEDRIACVGWQMQEGAVQVRIDRIEIEPVIREFCFQPKVNVIHPEVVFSSFESQTDASLVFLYRNRFFSPQLEVQGGEMMLPSSKRLYYSLLPGENKEEVGTLTLSYSEDAASAPLFLCHVQKEKDLFSVFFDLREEDLSQLLPLTALIAPQVRREWEVARGAVDVRGQCVVDSAGALVRLEFTGSAHAIALESSSIGIGLSCEECTGTFSYPSSEEGLFFWDKLSASFLVKEADFHLSDSLVPCPFGMTHLNGELQLEPLKEPQLAMHGLVTKEEEQMRVTFSGKGSLQENDTFWSVIDCLCESPSGKQMQGVLSLCRHERDQDVLQLKIEHADYEHLDFFRFFIDLPGKCQRGSVSGSATWLFQEGVCLKASVDHCLIEDLQIAFTENQISTSIQKAEGECTLARDLSDQWKWEDLKLTWSGVDYIQADSHFKEAKGEIGMQNGKLLPSFIEGKWGDLSAEAHLTLQEKEPIAHFRLFGDAKALLPLKESKPYPIAVDGNLHFDEQSLRVDLNADLVGDRLTGEFYFENILHALTLNPLEVLKWKEGKVESSKITANSYAPFLSSLFPSVHCAGEFSCQALLLPSEIQLSIGGEDLLLQSQSLEIQLPQLKGNTAHFTYDLQSQEWQGTVPLFDAKVYSHDLHLPFVGVEADILIDGSSLQIPSLYADCAGLKLRGNLRGDIPKRPADCFAVFDGTYRRKYPRSSVCCA